MVWTLTIINLIGNAGLTVFVARELKQTTPECEVVHPKDNTPEAVTPKEIQHQI